MIQKFSTAMGILSDQGIERQREFGVFVECDCNDAVEHTDNACRFVGDDIVSAIKTLYDKAMRLISGL